MTQITIPTFDIPNWQLGGASCTLRISADQTFQTSDGDVILRGGDSNWYKTVSCTITGTTITVPQFTIDSTTDASDRNATYTGVIYDSNGKRRDALFSAYRIPHNFGASMQWSAVFDYNQMQRSLLPYSYPNIDQVISLINDQIAVIPPLEWGGINGDLTDQTDLQAAFDAIPTLDGYTTPSASTVGDIDTILTAIITALGGSVTDGTAPTVPTGLATTVLSSTSIKLDWNASTDNVGVTGYEISIDAGAAIDVGNVLTSTRTGLASGTTFAFRVRAYDAAGNRSAYSAAVNGSTSDVNAPTVPVMTAPTGVGEAQITWNWNASTDDVGVTGYDLQIATDSGFASIVSTHNLGVVLTYTKTGLTPSTQYYARVRAHDAVPNNSAYSTSTDATTTADVTAPTVPTMDAATNIGSSSIQWNWSAATDNVAVTNYDLQVAEDAAFTVNLATINLGNVLLYNHTGLSSSQIYYARVRAKDAATNASAYSSSVNATTDAPFFPDSLANLLIWNQFDTGLFTDYPPTVAATGTDAIATWEDQSGNGHHMIQTSGASQGLRASGSVDFDGTNDFLEQAGTDTPLSLKPVTFFMKVDLDSIGGNRKFLGSSTGGLSVDHNGADIRLLSQDTALIATSSATLTTGVHYLVVTYSGTGEYAFYYDGTLAGTGTNDLTIDSEFVKIAGSGIFLDGRVKEWGVYSDVKTGSDITDLNAYLAAL